MSMNRRHWLALLGAAAALPLAPALRAAERRVERVGLQLYTVRDRLAEDVPATLAAVAAAGYREVETAGTAGLDARAFAAALADVGLDAPAAHVPLDQVARQPEEVLAAADLIGYRYLVIPWLPPEQRTASGYARAVDVLNGFGERCAQAGRRLCYHNHDFEFAALPDGELPFDLLLRACDAELVGFELDFFWATHAGADALAYLAADPARYPLCHVKDRTAAGAMVDVGAGVIDFPALFAAGSGLEHYFVEHDRPGDSLASIRASFAAIETMRF
jgi:sugar phosphate isomerase/epimerase